MTSEPEGAGDTPAQSKSRSKLTAKERAEQRRRRESKEVEDKSIGIRIRILREELLGLSQYEFAARLKLTRGAVGNWERGRGIRRASLQHIAKTFGASLEWLLLGGGFAFTVVANESFEQQIGTLPPHEQQRLMADIQGLIDNRKRQHGIPVTGSQRPHPPPGKRK